MKSFKCPTNTLLQKRDGNSGKTKPRSKIDDFVLQNLQKHNFQGKVSDFLQNLDPRTAMKTTNDELLQIFENHIVKATKEVVEEITSKPDWLTSAKDSLMNLIHTRKQSAKNLHEKRNQ
jgi:5'(3')-deoxyribonucleotidase